MKLNPYFQIQQIGNSTVLLPSGKTGWRNHGVIQLDDQEEVVVVRCLVKETTEEELIAKVSHEIAKSKDDLDKIIRNVIQKLRDGGAIIE